MQRMIYQPTSSALPEPFGLAAYSVLDRLQRRQLSRRSGYLQSKLAQSSGTKRDLMMFSFALLVLLLNQPEYCQQRCFLIKT